MLRRFQVLLMTTALVVGLVKVAWADDIAPANDCDRLAAHPYDPHKIAKGVDWGKIDASAAIASCKTATSEYPNEVRFWFQLGRSFHKAKDYDQSIQWYRKAVKKGYAAAQFNLASAIEDGEGVKKDMVAAIKLYSMAANQRHLPAQVALGVMYDQGVGVKMDKAEAVKWYRKAAEQGYAIGQVNLGAMYDEGVGVKVDKAEAVKWYRRAAEQGDATGQVYLGQMYDNGEGVPEDKAEAVKWYRRAAEQGDVRHRMIWHN